MSSSLLNPSAELEAVIAQLFVYPVKSCAAVAVGVAGLFIETHPDPDRAPSDGPNMVPLKDMPDLLAELQAFDRLAKARVGEARTGEA